MNTIFTINFSKISKNLKEVKLPILFFQTLPPSCPEKLFINLVYGTVNVSACYAHVKMQHKGYRLKKIGCESCKPNTVRSLQTQLLRLNSSYRYI